MAYAVSSGAILLPWLSWLPVDTKCFLSFEYYHFSSLRYVTIDHFKSHTTEMNCSKKGFFHPFIYCSRILFIRDKKWLSSSNVEKSRWCKCGLKSDFFLPLELYNLIDKTLGRLCPWLQVAEFWEVMPYVFALTPSRGWQQLELFSPCRTDGGNMSINGEIWPVYTQITQICQYYCNLKKQKPKNKFTTAISCEVEVTAVRLLGPASAAMCAKAVVGKKCVGTKSAANTHVNTHSTFGKAKQSSSSSRSM